MCPRRVAGTFALLPDLGSGRFLKAKPAPCGGHICAAARPLGLADFFINDRAKAASGLLAPYFFARYAWKAAARGIAADRRYAFSYPISDVCFPLNLSLFGYNTMILDNSSILYRLRL